MFIMLDRRGIYNCDELITPSALANEIAQSHMAVCSELMVPVHHVYIVIVIIFSGKGYNLIDS